MSQLECTRRWRAKNPKKCHEYSIKWRTGNRKRQNELVQKWRKNNKDKVKNGDLKRKYGITLDDLKRMEIEQDFVCAICKKRKPLCIDHNHNTGKVRGLLCHDCNRGIGLFADNIEIFETVILYLKTESHNK